jgi:hypothetical protein
MANAVALPVLDNPTDRQAQLRVWRSGARDCDRDKKATAPVTAIRHVVKYGLI